MPKTLHNGRSARFFEPACTRAGGVHPVPVAQRYDVAGESLDRPTLAADEYRARQIGLEISLQGVDAVSGSWRLQLYIHRRD